MVKKSEEFKERLTARSEVVEVSKDLYKLLVEGHIGADMKELILVPDNV